MDLNFKTIEDAQDEIELLWRITNHCNYHCSYCPSDYHDAKKDHEDLDYYINLFDYSYKKFDTQKTLTVYIDGGEPTRLPCLYDLCKYIKNNYSNTVIKVGTNGSQSFDYFIKLSEYVDTFVFSLHFDWVKLKPFIKKVSNLHLKLGRNRINTQVMAEIGHYRNCKLVCEFFTKCKIWFNLCSVNYDNKNSSSIGKNILYDTQWQDLITKYSNPNHDYDMLLDGKPFNSPEFKNIIRSDKKGKYTYSEGFFKDWMCYAPSKVLQLEKGILATTCGLVSYGTPDSNVPLKEMIKCDGRSCNCTASIRTKKYLPND